jgi:hypothetical protein
VWGRSTIGPGTAVAVAETDRRRELGTLDWCEAHRVRDDPLEAPIERMR